MPWEGECYLVCLRKPGTCAFSTPAMQGWHKCHLCGTPISKAKFVPEQVGSMHKQLHGEPAQHSPVVLLHSHLCHPATSLHPDTSLHCTAGWSTTPGLRALCPSGQQGWPQQSCPAPPVSHCPPVPSARAALCPQQCSCRAALHPFILP